MKFAEIVIGTITNPQAPKNLQGTQGWFNSTNSHFLVISAFPSPFYGTVMNPNPPNSVGTYINEIADLYDPNGNIVDHFAGIELLIQKFTDSMTVWNGTSMISEPITHTSMIGWSITRHSLLVPPNFSVGAFKILIGYFLTDVEVQEYILHGGIPPKLEVQIE